jgi:tRNA (mo5U34)-methyltransferase
VPKDRYAKMRNVWFVPAPDVLLGWLHRLGLQQPRMVDMTVTSTREQRRTEWMDFQSLADFLDPEDAGKTVEGYPAPVRAIFLAERP